MESRVQLFSFVLLGLALSSSVGSSYAAEISNDKSMTDIPNRLADFYQFLLHSIVKCPPLDPCKVGNTYMDLYNDNLRQAANCPPQPQRCSPTSDTAAVSDIDKIDSAEPLLLSPCPLIAKSNEDLTTMNNFKKYLVILHCIAPSLIQAIKT